ncbi:MAG TPA: hypothetical protein VFN48_05555 [Solirubrobacteraceae bacterium]|nr:hypothetical protein [Solirubrobacteraceae bacterium]
MDRAQINRDAALDRLRRVNRGLAAGSVIGMGAFMGLVATEAHAKHRTVVVPAGSSLSTRGAAAGSSRSAAPASSAPASDDASGSEAAGSAGSGSAGSGSAGSGSAGSGSAGAGAAAPQPAPAAPAPVVVSGAS